MESSRQYLRHDFEGSRLKRKQEVSNKIHSSYQYLIYVIQHYCPDGVVEGNCMFFP